MDVLAQKPQSVYDMKGQLLVQGCSHVLYHKTGSQAYADNPFLPHFLSIGQLAAGRAALQGNGCLSYQGYCWQCKNEAPDDTSEAEVTTLGGARRANQVS